MMYKDPAKEILVLSEKTQKVLLEWLKTKKTFYDFTSCGTESVESIKELQEKNFLHYVEETFYLSLDVIDAKALHLERATKILQNGTFLPEEENEAIEDILDLGDWRSIILPEKIVSRIIYIEEQRCQAALKSQ